MKRLAGLAIALIVAIAAIAAVDRAVRPMLAQDVETEQADLSPKECDTDADDDTGGDDWAWEVQLRGEAMRLRVAQLWEAGVPEQWHWEEIGFPPWSVA